MNARRHLRLLERLRLAKPARIIKDLSNPLEVLDNDEFFVRYLRYFPISIINNCYPMLKNPAARRRQIATKTLAASSAGKPADRWRPKKICAKKNPVTLLLNMKVV